MVMIVNFMLCVFYHKNKDTDTIINNPNNVPSFNQIFIKHLVLKASKQSKLPKVICILLPIISPVESSKL